MTRTLIRQLEVSQPLDAYLSEIRRDTLLSAKHEASLAEAIARGDRDARARMIQANLRLVVKIARQFLGRGLQLEDLIGEGNLGLIRAAQDYDPGFGTRFSTYAAYWIKQSIRQALTNTTAIIRLPAHMVGLLGRWRRTERSLHRELGRDPTFSEIADSLQLTATQRELVTQALCTRHLVQEGCQGGDTSWTSDEACDPHDAPDLECEAREERMSVLRRLDRLDERERIVVSLRFGLEGGRPLTLKEIGKRLGVTREWVRKIELRAVRKLDDRRVDWSSPRRARLHGRSASVHSARVRELAQTA
jgi:RNA polymerase primary sigma factor